MTKIQYKINNQSAKTILTDDYETAKTMQKTVMDEEIAEYQWWSIIAHITNNDGTVTMCPINLDGIPCTLDDEGNQIPYIDNTTKQE